MIAAARARTYLEQLGLTQAADLLDSRLQQAMLICLTPSPRLAGAVPADSYSLAQLPFQKTLAESGDAPVLRTAWARTTRTDNL